MRRFSMAASPAILENIRIASPCTASWDAMIGDDKSRFCGQCKLNVYNLSAMSRQAAGELVRKRDGRLCVRFYRRDDGTMLTQDCPVGLARLRKKLVRLVGGLAAAIAFAVGFGGCGKADAGKGSGATVQPVLPAQPLMGSPVPDPPQPEMGQRIMESDKAGQKEK
jgi:hypothetical protein